LNNITIYGGSSMAGHMIYNYLSSKENYSITTISESEIFPKGSIIPNDKILSNYHHDYIINCIRCLVEDSELYPSKAIMYNSYFPRMLENLHKKKKTKIIHLSTDCVFSGKNGNYKELSVPDGYTIYARTKSIGEINNDKDITIRTSYIGPNINGINEELFDWFIKQKGEVNGYKNAFWNGITTLELAKKIKTVIEDDICGIYHLCGNQKISKFNLLKLIKNIWSKDNVQIKGVFNNKIDRSLIDTRKELTVLPYENMFRELYNYMHSNKKLYEHYNEQ